ncbi:hypothetical protein ACTXT7_006492 [Hymenolepis weldensis]
MPMESFMAKVAPARLESELTVPINPRKSVFLSLFLAQMERWLHKAKENSALSSNQDCVLSRTLVPPHILGIA